MPPRLAEDCLGRRGRRIPVRPAGNLPERIRQYGQAGYCGPVQSGSPIWKVAVWVPTTVGAKARVNVQLELAGTLPPWLFQIHSSRYLRPSQLPDGGVLVVGTGQSGAQIAEEIPREQ